jgi:hypothetical protein
MQLLISSNAVWGNWHYNLYESRSHSERVFCADLLD